MVHPDDRALVSNGVVELEQKDESTNLEYRMLSKHGYIWIVDQSKYMKYQGKRFLQGVIMDISESVSLRSQMEHLLEYLPESVSLLGVENGDIKFKLLSTGFFEQYGYTLQTLEQALTGQAFFCSDEPQIQDVKEKLLHAMDCRTAYSTSLQICLPENSTIGITLDARPVERTADNFSFLCICEKTEVQQ